MKKIIIGLIGIFLVFFSSIIVNASVNSDWADSNNMAKYKQVDTEFRAVWVATVSNIDISKQKNKSDEAINEWKQNYLSILDNAEKYNLNAIIFQIRPCNDAFYPSKYNPWSEFLFAYGKDPGWDPLEWMIEVTHERGIEYHAWMNPYRASLTMSTSIVQSTGSSVRNVYDYDNDALQKSKHETFSDLKANCEKAYDGTDVDNPVFATGEELEHNVVMGTENKYVLNPASENTIEHLENTIREVVENYDIDGIHFDDYFYPDDAGYLSTGSNSDFKGLTFSTESIIDYQDYQNYLSKGGTLDIYNWRRENVNQLIERLSILIRNLNQTRDKPCAFGISPSGRWAPSIESCPAGSHRGAEGGMSGTCNNYYSYSDLFADTKKWVDEEWIDYLIPQAYTQLLDGYREIMDWWSEKMVNSPVKLYAGTALYQLDEWGNQDEVYYQVRYNQSTGNRVDGYSLFSYKNMNIGKGKIGMNYMHTLAWKTNALTPTYDFYNYKHTIEKNASVLKIEELSEKNYRLTYDIVNDAKGYALYKIISSDEIVNGEIDASKLYKMNLGNKNYFDIEEYDENAKYYLATISDDNTIYLNSEEIDFSILEKNVAPIVTLVDEMISEVLVNATLKLKFRISDENQDPLSYKVYLVYRNNDSEITNIVENDDTIEISWHAYAVETMGLKFKIVVSDGKVETIFETPTFNVVETCNHEFIEATCETPKTCTKCGETEGVALGHNWVDATCEKAKHCTRCEKTEGVALGHNWVDATCEKAKHCTRCEKTEGVALGHNWVDATYEEAKHCTRCEKTEGEPLKRPTEEDSAKGCSKCNKANIVSILLMIYIFGFSLILIRRKGR